MSLLALPPELLEHVLSFLHPADIVHLGQTSRLARHITKPSNSVLWHTAFLQVFDNPQNAWKPTQDATEDVSRGNDRDDTYWHNQLNRRLIALAAISPYSSKSYKDHGMSPEEIISVVLEIIDTAQPEPTKAEIARGIFPQVDDRRSLNLQLLSVQRDRWNRLEDLILDAHVAVPVEIGASPGRPMTRSLSLAMRNGLRSDAASRLHVLYGRTVRERIDHGAKGAARRIVYDWGNPVTTNDYGPFQKDGSGVIDWKTLEAVTSVMLRHFEMGAEGRIAIPQGFCYSIPYRTLTDPTVPGDWARVTGSWIGTYSFLDYADLFSFNTDDNPRWTLEDTPEAHGDLMMLDLKIEPNLQNDYRLQTKLPRCEDYPVLYFTGTSRSFDHYGHRGMAITVIGSASMCVSRREIRWRFIISYRSQEQWQLEGVQPGGVRSGPVYGVWTQWGHEDHSPVGAFLYVPEELCKKQELVAVGRSADSI